MVLNDHRESVVALKLNTSRSGIGMLRKGKVENGNEWPKLGFVPICRGVFLQVGVNVCSRMMSWE